MNQAPLLKHWEGQWPPWPPWFLLHCIRPLNYIIYQVLTVTM